MASLSRKRFTRLIELQMLVKARNATVLAGLEADRASLRSEDQSLLEMQNRRFENSTSIVSAEMIVNRLDANSRRKAGLDFSIERERRSMLRHSRVLDILDRRLVDFDRQQERTTLAIDLDEYMGGKSGADR